VREDGMSPPFRPELARLLALVTMLALALMSIHP
jgi:hypothetical protein